MFLKSYLMKCYFAFSPLKIRTWIQISIRVRIRIRIRIGIRFQNPGSGSAWKGCGSETLSSTLVTNKTEKQINYTCMRDKTFGKKGKNIREVVLWRRLAELGLDPDSVHLQLLAAVHLNRNKISLFIESTIFSHITWSYHGSYRGSPLYPCCKSEKIYFGSRSYLPGSYVFRLFMSFRIRILFVSSYGSFSDPSIFLTSYVKLSKVLPSYGQTVRNKFHCWKKKIAYSVENVSLFNGIFIRGGLILDEIFWSGSSLSGHFGSGSNLSGHFGFGSDLSGHFGSGSDLSGHFGSGSDLSGHFKSGF